MIKKSKSSGDSASITSSLDTRLNSLLDDTLDELEEEEIRNKVAHMKQGQGGGVDNDENNDDGEAKKSLRAERERMKALLDEMNNPSYGNTIKQTLQSLSTTSEGIKTVDNLFANLNGQYDTQYNTPLMPYPKDPNSPSEVEFADRNIAGTMKLLGTMQQGMEGMY